LFPIFPLSDSAWIYRYSVAMGLFRRTARIRRRRGFRIGLILLFLLGAPLNLAQPDAMAGLAMPRAMMTMGAGSHHPDPGMGGGAHGSPHDHASLCLFCTALGGPSLAGASVDPASGISAASFTEISFNLESAIPVGGRSGRTQCCRGPPMTV
jgi:hypothetical protein